MEAFSFDRVDRTITLYGYLRGTNLPASGARVHIPGAGDLTISTVEKLKDPCPLPTADGEKRRRMGEKGKLIHAPMSDVGGMVFDKVRGRFLQLGYGVQVVTPPLSFFLSNRMRYM